MAAAHDETGALGRRDFLGVAGAGLVCTIGGRALEVRTQADAARADVAAAALPKPPGAMSAPPGSLPVDRLTFAAPGPQPGGVAREHWIAARTVRWDPAPSGRDAWMKRRIPGPRSFRAYVYQQYSAGFAAPIGPATMPGPTLEAEVGDTLVVHVRNADERLRQAITLHPHGVRYNPEYDGAYLGDFTRAGGFIAPGEEFTYTWEATPDSVGVWPYHDHGPNHTLNTFRGLFGALIVRPRGAPKPDREYVLYLHSFPPPVTGRARAFQCVNGRTAAGNTPTLTAKVGDEVAIHVIGGDSNHHTFHVHGHRWPDAAGRPVDTPTVGPNEVVTARWREDNPGRWLYHCHVFAHQDAGMAGWYIVDP